MTPDQSKATFRVREQLVGINFLSDAVGTTGAVNGQLALQPDGRIVSEASRITVDVRTLVTDNQQRDMFIKSDTMQVQQFPLATFVPVTMQGVPSPLPASGEFTFTLTGRMTVHGVTKDQTWQITARRDGTRLTGTATTTFKFGDYGMQQPRVPLVLSVVDEIRLEIALVATQAT